MYEKHFTVTQTVRKSKRSNQQSTVAYSIEDDPGKLWRDLPKEKTFQQIFLTKYEEICQRWKYSNHILREIVIWRLRQMMKLMRMR